MIRRPKPGENEEDILRMQADFLKEKSKNENMQPSAQVVNICRTQHQTTKRTNTSCTNIRKPSKYAQSKGLTNYSEKRPRFEENKPSLVGDILEKNNDITHSKASLFDDDNVYFPKILPLVLGNIIEKNTEATIDLEYKAFPAQGFPNVVSQNPSLSTKKTKQQGDQVKKQTNSHEMLLDDSSIIIESNQHLNLPKKSYILTNKAADELHIENVKILSGMSENEILEERKKLLQSLDPNLVDFIKSKRNQQEVQCIEKEDEIMDITENKKSNRVTIKTDATPEEDSIDYGSLWENDVLSHPNIDKWLHFNSLEVDKLEWIKGIYDCKIKSNEPYEARFDFNGYLLPYTMEYTEKTKILFHHGEESHRPGYSLTELIELSRSGVPQQRVMALNCLAGILEYYNAGTYKNIIEIPLSKLFFIIRISMDENKLIILEPALKAMRNLLYNRIDEASLDAIIGLKEGAIQPCLENDKSEIEEIELKESEIKDFHLAEIDLIAALIRTDILQRLFYILDKIKPTFNCVQYSLQILTRLARDSLETASKIVQTEHLMNAVINHFVPSCSVNFMFNLTIVYNKPILAALKFLRVLTLTSKEIGEQLIKNYNILKPISKYISSGVDGTYGLKLQIESYYILSNLLQFKLGIEHAKTLCPVVITTLFKHVQGTSIFINSSVLSATHCAVVLQFIGGLINCEINMDFKAQIYPLLKDGMQKWLLHLTQLDAYTCGHLKLVCSILNCFENVLITENIATEMLNEVLLKLSKSQGYQKLTNNLIPSSNLLSGIEDTKLHFTENLVSLGTLVIDSEKKILPTLNSVSPFPVLGSLFKLLYVLNNRTVSQSFLEQTLPYLQQVTTAKPCLINNWFTRMEVDFLFSLVKLSIESEIPESLKDLVYAVASKLCYIFRIDKGKELNYLFVNIIFNKEWFTAERRFNLVSLSEADGFSKALTNIEDIKLCYCKVVNLNYVDTGPFIVYKLWQNPILPRDWIYLPILSLYSKSQETPRPAIVGKHATKIKEIATDKENIIRCSLEWILFNEICFPDLLNDIDITDRFCRIMCVFLCDNSLFLDNKIKMLLSKCTQLLFKKGIQFDFDKELVGLYNFQDFYTQFLEQFQSVSYGDHIFAACLLVPLAQRHNVKWRKLVWSEYAGCLRVLDCPEDLLCYGIEAYLYPEETDESVLKSYHRALTSNLLRPETLAYKIAHHHVESYKKQKSMSNNL
ncbi:RNA polymerase II-associated protein 1 [Pieris napi]|uniref:RNA polymerase II-associated protein 1 n=1 Tax=Pieris napi TaxID=78633 RepID=UPI001FBA3C7D|nr:RNA polymerase II-associated protein 1 [Pieris napi]